MLFKKCLVALTAAASISLSQSAVAEEPSIPYCDKSYGKLALREPNRNNYWWRRYNLENPEALLKYYVSESGCFTMVDRGEGLDMRRDERNLADSGELQVDSNFGGGQVVAADFFLVPDLLAKDKNSGGKKLGGLIAGKLGGKAGGLLGGLKTKKLEAEAILTLVNARTSVQQASTRGKAQKTDVSFGGGGLIGGIAGIGGGYADTNIGRVISAAYADAYTQLVNKVKGGSADINADAPSQSYVMAVASELYSNPSRGSSVRKLRAGMRVYPTGKREGAFMEAKDKFGTTGWVSVEDLQ
ncbi:MAG: CsgG/HfaB family protein [Gammaproteobacteria bacterium]